MNDKQRKRAADILRISRKIHRLTGAFLFAFFFIIAVTGLLLGWKKNSGGYILPDTTKGVSKNLNDWKPVGELQENAVEILKREVSPDISTEVDRLDIRPDKGIVKFSFKEHLWEIQLDGATGELTQIGRRNSDFIESIHDGSILDYYVDTDYGQIKLLYTTVMGIALLIFTITGFWLWLGPKRYRARSKHHQNT